MTSILQQYTLEDFVKCRNQKEWVCDNCMNYGDDISRLLQSDGYQVKKNCKKLSS